MLEMTATISGVDPATQGVKNGGTDIHLTPPEIVQALLRFWPDGIDLDPCSNEGKPNIPAQGRYTIKENGLLHPWKAGTLFINPPYSENKTWSEKFLTELQAGNFREAVVLNKNDNRVGWFPAYQDNCDAFCIVKGYLKFSGVKTGAKFPSVLWYYGHRSYSFKRAFSEFGWCYESFSHNNPTFDANLTP